MHKKKTMEILSLTLIHTYYFLSRLYNNFLFVHDCTGSRDQILQVLDHAGAPPPLEWASRFCSASELYVPSDNLLITCWIGNEGLRTMLLNFCKKISKKMQIFYLMNHTYMHHLLNVPNCEYCTQENSFHKDFKNVEQKLPEVHLHNCESSDKE